VGDFALAGDFVIEQKTNNTGDRRLTVAANNVSVQVGTIQITGGSGVLILLPDRTDPDGTVRPGGLAGTLSASIDLGGLIEGISFTGSFGLAINQTGRLISETVNVGGNAV